MYLLHETFISCFQGEDKEESHSVPLMLKAQPLWTSAKWNLRDRVLGEVKNNNFIVLPGKGGHGGLLPSKTVCPNPKEIDEEFL